MQYIITEELLEKAATVVVEAAKLGEPLTVGDVSKRADISPSAARHAMAAMYDYGALHCVHGYLRGIVPGTWSASFTISTPWAMARGSDKLCKGVLKAIDSGTLLADDLIGEGCAEYFPNWVYENRRGSNGRLPRD